MKILKKTLVAAGIATALFATGAAQAATISTPSTAAAPAPVGKTIVNEASRAIISPVATVVSFPVGEGLSIDDSITFTLSSGTWAAIANADLTDTNANATTYSLVEGGVGSASAKFRVGSENHANGAPFTVTLAATATINGTAVAASGSINNTVQMSGFVGGVATSLFSSPLTSLTVKLAPMMTTAITATTSGTFDVASGYQQFLNTAANTSSLAAPFVASSTAAATQAAVTITANAATAAGSTTALIPAAVATPGSTILTITGPMTGLTSITESIAGEITSSTSTGAAPTGGTVANAFFINTSADAAYAVFAAGNNNPGVADVLNLIWTFSSTVGHDISAYTLAVSRVADGSYAATIAGGGSVAAFSRNGSAFTSNSFGPLNKITVTDRSGSLGGTGAADGAISLNAWDTAGASVTCTGLTIPNLTSNGTVTIQGADVITACPGTKRVDGNVNSNAILVTNVKITADGATATPALSSGGVTAAQ